MTKAAWRKRFWEIRPLRQKLSIVVLITFIPISLIASLLAINEAKKEKSNNLRTQLLWDAQQARSFLDHWTKEHGRKLILLSEYTSIRQLKVNNNAKKTKQLLRLFPNYSILISERNGNRIRESGDLLRPLTGELYKELLTTPKTILNKSTNGYYASGPLLPPYTLKPCYSSSQPIYSTLEKRNAPIGTITSCITLGKLGNITGIDSLIKGSPTESRQGLPLINLTKGIKNGYALIVVGETGEAVVVGLSEADNKDEKLLLDPQRNEQSLWGPFIEIARQNTEKDGYMIKNIGGMNYYIAISRGESGRTTLMIIDERTAYRTIDRLFIFFWAGNIIALIISSLATSRIFKTLSRPIEQVGETLSEMSHGVFKEPLPTNSSDVGRMFHHLNEASEKLKRYLKEAKEHAVTDAQLEEARRIQADFLIKNLPNTQTVEFAAVYKPAYQIGADWYDVIIADHIKYVVVADVCDKGIPSALYMSVFRSLLRLSLVNETNKHEEDPGKTICRAIDLVNQYMAKNHSESCMFATCFVGGYDETTDKLHYVVAGHEAPLVLHGEEIEQMKIGGPAIGIFETATFQSSSCDFNRDDMLLAFSDGLQDVRNPQNESLGVEEVIKLLQSKYSSQWSAQMLANDLEKAFNLHKKTAEQFDDLTILCMKAKRID